MFSREEGVGPWEKGILLPYMQRISCKGFMFCIQSFVVEDIGC
jgi:hypothetical protein